MIGGASTRVGPVVTLVCDDDHQTELTVHEQRCSNEQIVDVSRAAMEQCLDKMASRLAET